MANGYYDGDTWVPNQDALAEQKVQSNSLKNALYGPNQEFGITGTAEAKMGGLEGLQLGQLLYGQGLGDVGAEAGDYSQKLRERLGVDSAEADRYRNQANSRLSKSANNLGIAGASLGGAREQLYRQSSMAASAQNQDYKDKALAAVGKNIGAKQQGIAGQYMAGKGIGQAATPVAVPQYSSGSIICTELYNQGKLSKYHWMRSSVYGYSISPYTYFGYLTIAKPIVKLMKKSDKFSNLFIGWAKSIAKQRPNLLTRALMPLCWVIGYAKGIAKEEAFREA
jgi:hypothetical protein